MSIKLITDVWGLKLQNEGERLVLLALADNANDEGTHCFPSLRRIAWKTDFTVKAVSAIIIRLEKKGLVETLNKGNQYKPTNYALHLDKGEQKEEFVPSPWAISKVKSIETGLHLQGSEVHPDGSELHLEGSELHLDAKKEGLTSSKRKTSSSHPSVEPSVQPSVEPSGSSINKEVAGKGSIEPIPAKKVVVPNPMEDPAGYQAYLDTLPDYK